MYVSDIYKPTMPMCNNLTHRPQLAIKNHIEKNKTKEIFSQKKDTKNGYSKEKPLRIFF